MADTSIKKLQDMSRNRSRKYRKVTFTFTSRKYRKLRHLFYFEACKTSGQLWETTDCTL